MTRDTFDMFQDKPRGRFGDDESESRAPARSDLVDLNLVLHLDSQKKQAIAVSHSPDTPFERWVWLPRSKIEYESTGQVRRTRTVRVTLPEYLAKEKGLI